MDIFHRMPINAADRLDGEIRMSDERPVNFEQGAAPQTKPKQTRQRSSIPFAYIDLQVVMGVAAAIHDQVGSGDCDEHQLAAWLGKSEKSSGFRILLSTARLFGLLDTDGAGNYRLTQLGRMAMDPAQEREARARAFLTVPLYNAVFEKYRSGILPPGAALERELVQIGVAEKQKHTARLVLERSAQYAGFTGHGKERLVMPGISLDDKKAGLGIDEHKRSGGGEGGGGQPPALDPLIAALIQKLPPPKTPEWKVQDRIMWLQMAAMAFQMAYGPADRIEITQAEGIK
ncbi:MAG: hypothetical protein WB678_00180 [Stellaceae bacterium]